MKNSPKQHETHLYFDTETMREVQKIAKVEDRSITATLRVLVKEALMARKGKG